MLIYNSELLTKFKLSCLVQTDVGCSGVASLSATWGGPRNCRPSSADYLINDHKF
jgi:hypothetical protein